MNKKTTNEELIAKYNNSKDIRVKQRYKDQIVVNNLALVRSIAKKYQYNREDYEDLIHEGTLGLMQALENYDSKIAKFTTYASFYIKRAMINYVKSNNDFYNNISDNENFDESDIIDVESEKNNDTLKLDLKSLMCNNKTSKYILKELIKSLSLKQQAVLTMYYGLNGESPKSFAQISEIVDVSCEAVRRLHDRAIATLRENLGV